MSKLSKIFFRVVLVVVIGLVPWRATAGGRTRVESGSVVFLKQEKRVNLEYDYDGMKVDRNPEQEFVARQVARENEKYPGRGDIWRQEWIGQRTIRFQPKFQELLNKQFVAGDVPLEFGAFIDAKSQLSGLETR